MLHLLFWTEDGGITFLRTVSKLLSDYTVSHCRRHSDRVWDIMKENSRISDKMSFDFWEEKIGFTFFSWAVVSVGMTGPHPSSDLHVIVISILSEAVLHEHCSLYIIQVIYHLYVGRKLICKVHCHSILVPSLLRRKSCIMQLAYLLM
jgi:hypothetical protein